MPIKRLSIENLAIIESLDIDFEKGLNIITGETGAGKSIIISSLKLILGNKADADMIRAGEDKLTVEAEFSELNPETVKFIRQTDPDFHQPLVIRREVYKTRRSRIFINDTPVSSELITGLGNIMIDIHGQHDHQSLLNKDTHITILDERAGISTLKTAELYAEDLSLNKEIERIIQSENDLKDKRELLEYHYKEINEISPEENEDKEISTELKKMENIEDIKKICQAVTDTVSGSESSLLSKLNYIKNKCGQLSEIDKQFEPFIIDLESAYSSVTEFGNSSELFSNSLEFDDEKYGRMSERYSQLKKLMKKFGPELSDVIKYFGSIKNQLDSIENVSFDKDKLLKRSKELKIEIEDECSKLTSKRKEGIKKLEKEINAEFKDIGLQNAEISVAMTKKDIAPDGWDSVEFYIRTNIGEESKPLSKIASGGEISRIMLSIKNIISSEKGVGIAVFDEIDSGISGQIAEKVGTKLLKLAQNKQVIAITHLPSIASKGTTHFSVRKKVVKDRTLTEIIKLSKVQRIDEIASLISAGKTGTDSKKVAEKLLEN
jgi:DNA repair protein RecN (Recombination protein N)